MSGQQGLLAEIERTAAWMQAHLPPTPQLSWPRLNARSGRQLWVKHENHQPLGTVAVRAALVYLARLNDHLPPGAGLVAASHGALGLGQGLAWAAARSGRPAVIVVPEETPADMLASLQALGAEVAVGGEDLHDAAGLAAALAEARGLHAVPLFHPWLVQGLAGCALELFRAQPELDEVYVPVGMGNLIAATIAVRDALALSTRIVGVVAERAPAYADSFWGGRPLSTPTANTLARGLACRQPDPMAVSVLCEGADRLLTVSDEAMQEAVRLYAAEADTLADAAAAAPLAALLADPGAGARVGLILSGGGEAQSSAD
ncbi:L-threonine dehydratase biosynthetic IlvA [mine drainage metagenome]|uniref:L-threonine dehydratase biosynthetic IlvA n=1 Tax=mine drainage metagenome TaxID=410659 RepID=A0A1J5RQG8_9ZZZZ